MRDVVPAAHEGRMGRMLRNVCGVDVPIPLWVKLRTPRSARLTGGGDADDASVARERR